MLMSYDKSLLKQRLYDYVGSSQMTCVIMAEKTGLSIRIVEKICRKEELKLKFQRGKAENQDIIFKLFGINIPIQQGRNMQILCNYSQEELVEIYAKSKSVDDLRKNLGVDLHIHSLMIFLRQKKIVYLAKKKYPHCGFVAELGVRYLPKPKEDVKRFKPVEMGKPDPLAKFDLKAELKKVRENQSQ